MSPQDSDFDQLLSSYLDGAVTDEERAAIEDRLDADPAAVADLAELRSLCESVAAADLAAEVRLPAQFADQVVEAAIERARLEGHPDDHPLLRSATQPLGPAAPGATLADGRRWWAASGVGLAVAASLLVAVTLLRPDDELESAISLADSQSINGGYVADGPASLPTASPDVLTPDAVDMADASTSKSIPDAPDASPFSPTVRPVPNLDSVAVSTDQATTPAASAAAEFDETPSMAPAISPVTTKADSSGLKLAMVVNVQLSESALGMNVIRDAMRVARVDAENQQAVTDEIVAAVGQAAGETEASGRLIYLRAPAKQMARFMAALRNDRERVAQVSLALTDEPVLLNAVDDFSDVRETDVQHDFTGILSTEEVSMLRDRFDDVVFIPADAFGNSMVGVSPDDSGPDVISHLLVLIRQDG